MTEKLVAAIEKALHLNKEAQNSKDVAIKSHKQQTACIAESSVPSVDPPASINIERNASLNVMHKSSQCDLPMNDTNSKYSITTRNECNSLVDSDTSFETLCGEKLNSNVAGDFASVAKVDSCISTDSSLIDESSVEQATWNNGNITSQSQPISFEQHSGMKETTNATLHIQKELPTDSDYVATPFAYASQMEGKLLYWENDSLNNTDEEMPYDQNNLNERYHLSNEPCPDNIDPASKAIEHQSNIGFSSSENDLIEKAVQTKLSEGSLNTLSGNSINCMTLSNDNVKTDKSNNETKVWMRRKPHSIMLIRENLIRMSEEIKHASRMSSMVMHELRNSLQGISERISAMTDELEIGLCKITENPIPYKELSKKTIVRLMQLQGALSEEAEQLSQLGESIN